MTDFNDEIVRLKNEILALRQAKNKSIAQVEFKEQTVSSVTLQGYNPKVFYVEPNTDVFPLLSFRTRFVSGSIANSWLRTEWAMEDGKFKFLFWVDSNSPDLNPTIDIIFVSTSDLTITEG